MCSRSIGRPREVNFIACDGVSKLSAALCSALYINGFANRINATVCCIHRHEAYIVIFGKMGVGMPIRSLTGGMGTVAKEPVITCIGIGGGANKVNDVSADGVGKRTLTIIGSIALYINGLAIGVLTSIVVIDGKANLVMFGIIDKSVRWIFART